MAKQKSFNWSGIYENEDGSFTIVGSAARKRLLKEFHKAGLKVRSRKQPDGSYLLTSIGQTRPTRAQRGTKPTRSAGQIRVRYPRPPGSFGRLRVPRGPPQFRPQPQSIFAPNSPVQGSIYQRLRITPKQLSERKAGRVREEQRGAYDVDASGKMTLRKGFREYENPKTGGTSTVREEPRGFRERFFPSQERKEALQLARVQESRRVEQEMRERTPKYGSTRIPEQETERAEQSAIRRTSEPRLAENPKPSGSNIQRTTQLKEEQINPAQLQAARNAAMSSEE